MRRVAGVVKRFQADERGVFAVFFGLISIVLIALAGAVVDYTAVQQARTRTQQALDAAALGLQPTIFSAGVTVDTLKQKVIALLNERLDPQTAFQVATPQIDTNTGMLHLEATIAVPTAFVRLIGFSTLSSQIVSEARRRQLNLEVAMVLDNSGSMASSNRMTNLKAAAKCATNVLLNGACSDNSTTATASKVWIGIVPFTEFVNVGTGNRNAAWMDGSGTSAVAQDNFDNDNYDGNTFASAVNRFTLYSNLNISWRGCVEARDHVTGPGGLYYDTADLPPSSLVPQSLFAPSFAPDQPDSGYDNSYIADDPSVCPAAPTYVWTQTKTKCDDRGNNQNRYDGASCQSSGTTTNTYKTVVNGTTSNATSTTPSSLGNNPYPGNNSYSDEYSYTTSGSGTYKYTNTRVRTWTYQYSDRELQERLCKYRVGASVSSLGTGPGGRTGPNADCPSAALLPLTETKSSVVSKINAMNAEGGTNIHQGVMWGFHMLSQAAPLTEAGPYENSRSKAMIVMTDGENTHSYDSDFTGANWYTAYGYPYSGRLTGSSTARLETEMNARTEATCANAKAAGIIIYTIGLSPPNQATRDMLTHCASDADKAKFPASPSELTQVFENIADQLSNLRLAR